MPWRRRGSTISRARRWCGASMPIRRTCGGTPRRRRTRAASSASPTRSRIANGGLGVSSGDTEPARLSRRKLAWLLRRVAEAVESDEISTTLLTGFHAAIAEVEHGSLRRGRPWRSCTSPSESISPWTTSRKLLATLQAQPTAMRERFLRRFVEAWLVQQLETYEADHHGGDDG